MANNIFDWDDEEEKKASEDDVWGTYPLAQPPEMPPSEPVQPERWPNHNTYEPAEPIEPEQDTWIGYSGDQFQQPPAPEPGVWSEYKGDTPEEAERKGGLAWSAGIVFFSSVAFMLFLGWIADWLFGSSPWGVVGGIVLGSIVGFIQFFRISSRIFGSSKNDVAERPLMPRDDERER